MANFTIGGIAYQSRMLDGEIQVLTLKRLLPVFTALVGSATALNPREVIGADNQTPIERIEGTEDRLEDAEDTESRRLHDALMPAVRELSALRDEDVRFIIDACLDATKRQAGGGGIGWVDVRQRGIVQDKGDEAFNTRLTIVWHVLSENFGSMLRSLGLDAEMLSRAVPKAA